MFHRPLLGALGLGAILLVQNLATVKALAQPLAPASTNTFTRALEDNLRPAQVEQLSVDSASGSIDSAVNPVGLAFQITASSESSAVQISAARRLSLSPVEDGRLTSKELAFKLSSPLDKDDSATNVATLDGLANAGAIGVTFRRVVTTGFRNPETVMQMCDFAEITRVVRDRCADLAGADGLLTDDERRVCETGPVQFSSVKLSTAELKEVGCSFLETTSTTSFFGVSGKFGYDEFKVLNADALVTPTTDDDAPTTQSERPRSVGLFYGRVFASARASFLTGFDYQQAYKAATPTTLCNPPATNGLQSCTTGAFVGPTRQDKELVYFEFRRRTQKGGFNRQGMAFEPRITHDFEKDESALDVPIFLFKNADDQLTAGLRVGWTDEEDEWGLAIFVGSRFNLFETP
jgi:hypothetical protein